MRAQEKEEGTDDTSAEYWQLSSEDVVDVPCNSRPEKAAQDGDKKNIWGNTALVVFLNVEVAGIPQQVDYLDVDVAADGGHQEEDVKDGK